MLTSGLSGGLSRRLSDPLGGSIKRRGSSAPTAPLPYTGTVFAAIAHPSYCASDAAHVVPCADGDPIRWWKDAVTGTWYEQATLALRPVLHAGGVAGKWYAESDGTQYFAFGDLSAYSSVTCTFALACRVVTPVLYGMLLTSATSGGVLVRELRCNGAGYGYQSTTNDIGSSFDTPAGYSGTNDSMIAAYGATSKMYYNGTEVASTADTQSINLGNAYLFNRRTGTLPPQARIYTAQILDSTVAPGSIAALNTYLQGLMA